MMGDINRHGRECRMSNYESTPNKSRERRGSSVAVRRVSVMPWYVAFVVFVLMQLVMAIPASAELTIEITQGNDRAVRMAVAPFSWDGKKSSRRIWRGPLAAI